MVLDMILRHCRSSSSLLRFISTHFRFPFTHLLGDTSHTRTLSVLLRIIHLIPSHLIVFYSCSFYLVFAMNFSVRLERLSGSLMSPSVLISCVCFALLSVVLPFPHHSLYVLRSSVCLDFSFGVRTVCLVLFSAQACCVSFTNSGVLSYWIFSFLVSSFVPNLSSNA